MKFITSNLITKHGLLRLQVLFCLAAMAFGFAVTDKLGDPNINLIDDPKNAAIDFSQAIPGPDGTVCVQRKKYVDKTEKDQVREKLTS